jgi:hypothetical protein
MIAPARSRQIQLLRQASSAHQTFRCSGGEPRALGSNNGTKYNKMQSFLERRLHRDANIRGTYEVRFPEAPGFN